MGNLVTLIQTTSRLANIITVGLLVASLYKEIRESVSVSADTDVDTDDTDVDTDVDNA